MCKSVQMELWGSSTEFFAFRANLYRLSGFYFEILLLKAGLNYPGWWTENILHLYVLTVCNKNQHINFWKQNFWPLYKKPFRPITPSLGFSFVIISRSGSFFIYFAGFALILFATEILKKLVMERNRPSFLFMILMNCFSSST